MAFDRQLVDQIPRLRRYARALTGDVVRADDLVQDTLERAWRKQALWRHGSDLRAWLFTLMHNLHANQRRSESAAMLVDYDTRDLPAPGALDEDGAALRDILRGIAQLPLEMREVILLVGLEQFSYAEAAAVLGIPLGTVMSRLSRGRERLRLWTTGRANGASLKVVQ
jgi:RNA polymerase sigma-70 factor (ECF subfamily)